LFESSAEALKVGWVGLGAAGRQNHASLSPLVFKTYPRAAIKHAGGVAVSAMRARAKMAAKNKVEEAYMLTEFEIGYINAEKGVERVNVEGRGQRNERVVQMSDWIREREKLNDENAMKSKYR
jgi:hypothetical protein